MAFNDKDERDNFWNLDKLVPKNKPLSSFSTRSSSVLYTVDDAESCESKRDSGERKLDLSAFEVRGEEESYTPEGHSLIRRVVIKKHLDRFDFYDSFRKSAVLYFDCKSDKCDFVQFYSYMPQYSQLSSSQKSYYFYWRDMIRRGEFIKTDYSYLYLYVYEIINLPDLIPPPEGLSTLLKLWRQYRSELPRIDLYFSIWVQDYCLIHKLRAPTDEISDFIFDVITSSSFPEFYLSDWKNGGDRGLSAVLAYVSDYDYRRGKYALGNPDSLEDRRKRQAELYKIHMESSMRIVLSECDFYGESSLAESTVLRRDAFPNSLCTHAVKRRLEIEYYPISTKSEMRIAITAAVKYAENKLRALMGVKSRLAVKGLPDSFRSILDGYFEALEKRERRIREIESMPEYEKMYSAPKEKISFDSADEIEASSWLTTARLISEEEEDVELADVETDREKAEESLTLGSDNDADDYGLSIREIDFIFCLINEDTESFASVSDFELDEMVEKINVAFSDNFGDVIIEITDGAYSVIDDYREDVSVWLSTIHR